MREIGNQPNMDERLAAIHHEGGVDRIFDKHQGFVDTYDAPGIRTESVTLSHPTEKGKAYFVAQRLKFQDGETTRTGKALIMQAVSSKEGTNTAHLYFGPAADGMVYRMDTDMQKVIAEGALPKPGEVSEELLFNIGSDASKRGKQERKKNLEPRVGLAEMVNVLEQAEQAEIVPVSFAELEQIHINRITG